MVDWCVLVPGDLLLGDAQFMHNGTVAKKRVRVMGASLVVLLTNWPPARRYPQTCLRREYWCQHSRRFCKPATVQAGSYAFANLRADYH